MVRGQNRETGDSGNPLLPEPSQPPIVLITGPTGIGKSALAVDLAEELGGEVISADSRQVYRGLEIGTAQPTTDELARAPHHLIGFLAPHEPFSVAQFVDSADRALTEIASRGGVAFIVGGTLHYVSALLDRLEVPRVQPHWPLRRELERLAAELGPAELHARLARVDPTTAATIPVRNVRRLVRALEVIEVTGQPFSEVGRRRRQSRPALRLALTMPRPRLYDRLDRRVEEMLQAGWVEEVERLLAAGYGPDLPALTSTGYRELVRHLQGELSLDEAVRLVKYSTHAYVRRQYAWLRRDSQLDWLEQGPELRQAALARVSTYLTDRSRGITRNA